MGAAAKFRVLNIGHALRDRRPYVPDAPHQDAEGVTIRLALGFRSDFMGLGLGMGLRLGLGLSFQGSSLGPGLGLAGPPTVASAVRARAGVLSPSRTSVFPIRLMEMEAPPRAAPDLPSGALGASALCRSVMG